MNACDISYLYSQISGLITDLIDYWYFPFPLFFLPLDLGQRRKFEWLLIIFSQWTLTAGPKYVKFHKFYKT